MMPFAPPRLSMTSCCPHASVSFGPSRRTWKSAGPPAVNGTITRTGLAGYVCAAAWHTEAERKVAARIRRPAITAISRSTFAVDGIEYAERARSHARGGGAVGVTGGLGPLLAGVIL